ncbi:ABC transporter ATP-binding protein [Megasphaera cerevisiae]|uniref:ABC transporter ATP-binding protein n=1 Tax=Megasphaera cerevisiae TaxID=39029 RepID=UPI000943DAFF|nr:ABC transporter ATP-binding protein [Megasphaera cerevisiae]OKY52952.1 hypothetical protein BSR42_10020 [Megasphaera cerevisiae]
MIKRADIVLQLHNVSAGYASQSVLCHFNLAVQRGEMVGIIGPNGSGKSTLLKTICGFLPLAEGSIELCGKPVEKIRTRDFARKVAYLQQHEPVFPGYTVHDIVMTGRYPHLRWWQHEDTGDREIADACMKYTGISAFSACDILTLSGGQQQRVLFAKVLAQQTDVLLLDEPAAGLDVFYQEEIFRFCRDLCQYGKTILLVSHELPLASRFCTKLLLVGQGRIAAMGIPEEVLTKEKLSTVYGVPIMVRRDAETGHFDVYGISTEDSSRRSLLHSIINKGGGGYDGS